MAVELITSENSDYDLTSSIAVLTSTPSAAFNTQCQAYIKIGDGSKNLDGTGGNFEAVITVGGQTAEPSPQVINFSTAVRAAFWTVGFPVPVGEQVIIYLKSPNAADTDVDVTVNLYEISTLSGSIYADGTVWVDPNGTNSTAWPYGSAAYPTSTIANGKTIADAHKIQRINISGVISFTAAMENYELIGSGNIDVTEIVNINSQSVEHSTFRHLTITGIGGNAATIADQTRYTNCLIYAHTNINGVVEGGSVGGACSVRDTGYALFIDTFFGQGAPAILTVQAPAKCDVINMRGILTISGMDGGILNITMTDGSFVTIDNTCTAGTITLTGIGSVTDNSNGSTVIALADTPTVLHAATDAKIDALNNASQGLTVGQFLALK
jgi:hypothetical protein